MVSLLRSLLWGHRTFPSTVSRPSQSDRTMPCKPSPFPKHLNFSHIALLIVPWVLISCSPALPSHLCSCGHLPGIRFVLFPSLLHSLALLKYYLFLKSNPQTLPQSNLLQITIVLTSCRIPFLCCALNYLLRLSSTPTLDSKSYICTAVQHSSE